MYPTTASHCPVQMSKYPSASTPTALQVVTPPAAFYPPTSSPTNNPFHGPFNSSL
ncbi:hypothetical protein BDZ91DRAFT_742884 [Kalaharituber pfeilii]|nr:hypothetical protein BDZ91DRAFT_742884 [Kalaharituber pfeilii]